MNKWLYEICNNSRTIIPKSELMAFIGVCNKNGIVPSIEVESYNKYDKNNPYFSIDEGVVLTRVDELTSEQGLIIARHHNKGIRYQQLIKKGYDVYSALRTLRI